MKKVMKQSKLLFMLNLFSGVLALIVLILLTLTIIASKKADNANDERTKLTDYAMRFMNASGYLTGEARAYCATGETDHYNNYINEIDNTRTREVCIAGMNENGLSVDGKSIVNRMMDISDLLILQEKEAMKFAEKGEYLDASGIVLASSYNKEVTNMASAKLELLDGINDRTNNEIGELVMATRTMEVITFLSGVTLILLQIIAYYIIRKQVIRPIIIVESEARRIAKGDLSHEIELEPDTSEIGMLVNSMQITKWELKKYIQDISEKLLKMANRDLTVVIDMEYIGDFNVIQKSMQKIISTLNDSFSLVENAADQVAMTAGASAEQASNLAESSINQTASIEKVSADIMDITLAVSRTANSAQMATQLANAAGVALGSSNDQLQGMLAAMNEISDASGEIGKIIKTIEDIAFQTNILALNAAVEAARAGTAGKGFAVVADEVRNLATKSSEASKATSYMIENSLSTIKSGAKIAKSASNTFVEVMVNAGKAAEAMGSIYASSASEAETISNINSGMQKIFDTVKQTSIVAEGAATISEELAYQAQNLKKEVHQFKLK